MRSWTKSDTRWKRKQLWSSYAKVTGINVTTIMYCASMCVSDTLETNYVSQSGFFIAAVISPTCHIAHHKLISQNELWAAFIFLYNFKVQAFITKWTVNGKFIHEPHEGQAKQDVLFNNLKFVCNLTLYSLLHVWYNILQYTTIYNKVQQYCTIRAVKNTM